MENAWFHCLGVYEIDPINQNHDLFNSNGLFFKGFWLIVFPKSWSGSLAFPETWHHAVLPSLRKFTPPAKTLGHELQLKILCVFICSYVGRNYRVFNSNERFPQRLVGVFTNLKVITPPYQSNVVWWQEMRGIPRATAMVHNPSAMQREIRFYQISMEPWWQLPGSNLLSHIPQDWHGTIFLCVELSGNHIVLK